jgi:hypothetical protein
MGRKGCLETSARNYHSTLRNIPKDHTSHLRRGGSQKSHKLAKVLLKQTLKRFTFMWPCTVTNFFIIKPTDALISQIYFSLKLYIFRTVPLHIISSFTVHLALVYAIQVCRQLSSKTPMELQFHPGPARKLSTNLYGIYHCWVYSEWTDDGQRNCPKHVEFQAKINLGN